MFFSWILSTVWSSHAHIVLMTKLKVVVHSHLLSHRSLLLHHIHLRHAIELLVLKTLQLVHLRHTLVRIKVVIPLQNLVLLEGRVYKYVINVNYLIYYNFSSSFVPSSSKIEVIDYYSNLGNPFSFASY